jgi:hypothetical protein
VGVDRQLAGRWLTDRPSVRPAGWLSNRRRGRPRRTATTATTTAWAAAATVAVPAGAATRTAAVRRRDSASARVSTRRYSNTGVALESAGFPSPLIFTPRAAVPQAPGLPNGAPQVGAPPTAPGAAPGPSLELPASPRATARCQPVTSAAAIRTTTTTGTRTFASTIQRHGTCLARQRWLLSQKTRGSTQFRSAPLGGLALR